MLTGTIADLNTFIAGGNLRFTNAPGITADVALGITINDGGNTGPGLPLNAVASTTLVVSPLNKAPAVNAPATVSATEDVASAITGISFADPDAGPLSRAIPGDRDGPPDLVLIDLMGSRVTGGRFPAGDAPVLTVIAAGDDLLLTLDFAADQLATDVAIALLDGFAGRLEVPLRQLL